MDEQSSVVNPLRGGSSAPALPPLLQQQAPLPPTGLRCAQATRVACFSCLRALGLMRRLADAHVKVDPRTGLKRTLTTLDLTMIGVGGIIGAGVYVLAGRAAAKFAGPAVVLSFIFSGIACFFCALCYSELATMVPSSGSAYAFASATLGQHVGFAMGWVLMLEYLMGASTVAVGWSGYVNSLLADCGAALPPAIANAPYLRNDDGSWSSSGGTVNLPAVVICLLATALQIRGMQESATFNNIVVVIKVGVLLLFLVCCIWYVKPQNYVPFVPPEENGRFGFVGILQGSSSVFFACVALLLLLLGSGRPPPGPLHLSYLPSASLPLFLPPPLRRYIGFDAISTASAEAIDPQKSLPIATLFSLLLCTALYILVGIVITGLVSYRDLAVPDPIAVAVNAAGPALAGLRPIIKLGALFGLTSVIVVLIMGQARIFFAMADDGNLPAVFARVHPVYKTPWVTTLVTGVAAAVLAGLLPVDVLSELVSIGTLTAFVVVCAGVVVLRRKRPELPRPFAVPFSPYIPLLGALLSLVQIFVLPTDTLWRLCVWMVAGALVFYFYSRRHAKPWAEVYGRLLEEGAASSSSGSAGAVDGGVEGSAPQGAAAAGPGQGPGSSGSRGSAAGAQPPSKPSSAEEW